MSEQSRPLEGWCVVEILGHKKFAGYVSEQVIGSNALIRVDVPETDQGGVFTKPSRSPWTSGHPRSSRPAWPRMPRSSTMTTTAAATAISDRVAPHPPHPRPDMKTEHPDQTNALVDMRHGVITTREN